MSKSLMKTGIIVLFAIVVAGSALIVTGCSGQTAATGSTTATSSSATTATSATGSTSSTAGGTASTGTISTDPTRVVVGGKTKEEYAAELPTLQKAVDANPTDLTALQALAVAQYNTQAYDAAAATYLKMLQIKDDPMTHNNYANVLRDAKKNDQAKAEYEKAIAADPALTVAYLNLAGMYVREKNLTEAQKLLDRGIAATAGDDQKRLKTYKDQLSTTTT